jgi:two-component system OmpR family sensor kinase
VKIRIFWKILFGFWLTIILIGQLFWLMVTLLRPMPQPADTTPPRSGSIAMVAAAATIKDHGLAALQRDMQSWPDFLRNQLVIAPAGDNVAGTVVSDPNGQRYSIIQRPPPPRRDRGRGRGDRNDHDGPFGITWPFDTPWQLNFVEFFGGLLFSAVFAWYMTSPVQRIRAGFDRLAKGEFDTRLGPLMGRRRDEIADLARDFDTMAKRLEELVSARDRLLADVSHELRSPLARLQLAIGLARQDPGKVEASLDRISGEAARLDEMVGELLTLAKLESGVRHSEDYFDLAEVVKAVAEDAKFEAEPKGVGVAVGIDPPDEEREWVVLGNGKLISHAVENIVRNALKYSRKGQKVRVMLDNETAGFFRLRVIDQGPGVDEKLLGSLFKPFVQGAGDGQGFGLGLAIAERAIVAHGGSIVARNQPGAGLAIEILLPAAQI